MSEELDVRVIAPAQRHPMIFDRFFNLKPGEGFDLLVDHDPKPLWYQFQAEHSGEFRWVYVESGPEVWRVRIEKI